MNRIELDFRPRCLKLDSKFSCGDLLFWHDLHKTILTSMPILLHTAQFYHIPHFLLASACYNNQCLPCFAIVKNAIAPYLEQSL